jgi:hypothetical protein
VDERVVRTRELPSSLTRVVLCAAVDGYLVGWDVGGSTELRALGPDDLGEGGRPIFTLDRAVPDAIAASRTELALVYTRPDEGEARSLQRVSLAGVPLGPALPLSGSERQVAIAAGDRSYGLAWLARPNAAERMHFETVALDGGGRAFEYDLPFPGLHVHSIARTADGYAVLVWYAGPNAFTSVARYDEEMRTWSEPAEIEGIRHAAWPASAWSPRGLVVAATFVELHVGANSPARIVVQRFRDDLTATGEPAVIEGVKAEVPIAIAQQGAVTVVGWIDHAASAPHVSFLTPCD